MSHRVGIVTGAGSGIGRAVAIALAEAGWSLALAGRRRDRLEETARMCPAQTCPAHGREIVCIATDVAEPASVERLFAQTVERFGRLDLLFNNAGIFSPPATLDEVTDEDWNASVAVNLTGAFLCARAAFRQMRRQEPGGGRIVNNGSIAATVPRPLSAPYAATKSAMSGLTRSIALDGRPFGIACGQIDIGNAETEMTQGFTHGARQADGTFQPEAMMDVRHAAEAVVYMAGLPLSANVLFMTVMATTMPYVGRG